MSKTTNKTAIGIFTLVFAILLFGGIIFFGKVSLGRDHSLYVIYPQDSVNGLDIGSAVKFRGVKVGSVKSIKMDLGKDSEEEVSIPVVIEIKNSNLHLADDEEAEERLSTAIREGLRASLQLTSVVTGLLYVDLDFLPETPAVFHGSPDQINLPEIPTVPSNTSQMMKAVSTILEDISEADISGLSEQLKETAEEIKTGIAQIEFKKINENVVRLTSSAAALIEDPELKKLIANLNALTEELHRFSNSLHGQVGPLATDIKGSLGTLRTTLSDISETISLLQSSLTMGQGSIGQEFRDALIQINEAARSVRALTDYLQVNLGPESEPSTQLRAPERKKD